MMPNVGEATVCGVVNTLANLFGFVLILGLTPILQGQTKVDTLINNAILLGILILAVILMIIPKY